MKLFFEILGDVAGVAAIALIAISMLTLGA